METAAGTTPAPATSAHPPDPGADPALLQAKWGEALTFEQFLGVAKELAELWPKLYGRASVAPEWAERVRALLAPLRLLILSEDWCGDSVNTVPLLQRLTEGSEGKLELRLLARDEHLDLMDAHLTGTSRSIPAVIVLDSAFRELGWWGPRPAPLQRWVLETGLAMPKEQRYREVRTWYVRDRGATTLADVVPMLERLSAEAAARG